MKDRWNNCCKPKLLCHRSAWKHCLQVPFDHDLHELVIWYNIFNDQSSYQSDPSTEEKKRANTSPVRTAKVW